MEIALVVVVLCWAGSLVLFLRFLRTDHDQATEALLAQAKGYDTERQILLDRIQAPERAVLRAPDGAKDRPSIPFDDDDAFNEEMKRRRQLEVAD